jgi:hypothetical protein
MAFLCVSQQGEFKNTIKNFLGEIHVKNFWPKKLREKTLFSCRLSPSIFLIAFLAVSRMRSPETPQTYFLKSDLKTSKTSRKGR